jgi:hypothetical protein
MSGKIQQQIYTRERVGIFTTTDGFDTIAISEGLDKFFVKKYLHPFCLYYAPKSLTMSGQKNAALYPEAVTIFQPETGDMVIGQAVFVPTDFTGQRSAYFMHNYVIPAGIKEEWIKNPAKVFQITDFTTSYDIEMGKVLPEKNGIEHSGQDVLADKSVLLEKLGVTESHFKQLLFAVMTSIAGKKKVFISLNVPLQDYTKYAMQLLELLYLYLPYAHRRKLGAMTFSSAPESKNYIHVLFFEPGTLNYGDRSIEKQFIFDFADGRILGVDIEGEKHEYLEFALGHFSKSERMEDFFAFAEAALSGLPTEQKLELSSYYQLTDLYLTLNGTDTSIYNKNKVGFVSGLMKFLQVHHEEKPEMVKLFLKLLQEEKVAADSDHALNYIQAVLSINKILGLDEPFSFILATIKYHQNHPIFNQLWQLLEQDKPSHERVITLMNGHPGYEGVLEQYFSERFKHITRVEDILRELKLMLGAPFLLNIEKFIRVVVDKVDSSIKREHNPFKAVLAIKDFKIDREDLQFFDFKQMLMDRSVRLLLDQIRPSELNREDIMNFGKIFSKGMKVNDEKAKEKYLIVDALYQLLNMPARAEANDLRSLSKGQREQVRDILQQQLRGKVSGEHLPLLYIAYGSDYDEVDYESVLNHLIQYSDDKTVLFFIQKSQLLVGRDARFKNLLLRYFVSDPRSIWNDKTYKKELKSVKNRDFNRLLKEVELETAKNPIVKFIKKKSLKR